MEELRLTKKEMVAINTAQPGDAKYGEVFEAIAQAQIAKMLDAGYIKPDGEMPVLSPEEIGDNLNCDTEGKYPCSKGGSVWTVSVDLLLQAYTNKIEKWLKGKK